MSTLRRAYIGCRVMESAENYARADTPLFARPEERPDRRGESYYEDGEFWREVLDPREEKWGSPFYINGAVLSEWIARVPGLYWGRGAEKHRTLSPEAVEYRSNAWVTFRPWAKSQQVTMGGIGTLRLPPATDGFRLASLSTGCNASAGVPVLISPEVWEHHQLREGVVLGGGSARWQPMAQGWSSYFPSTRGIPRGYLVLDSPDEINVLQDGDTIPTWIHPFTVMEYYQREIELFDFVYVAADTGLSGHRQRAERFFDSYKDRHERYGRYLLAGDMVSPLWEARYEGPEDLRRADPSADSQLHVLLARVEERQLGQDAVGRLLEALSAVCDTPDRLRELGDEAGVPPAIWFARGTVAEVSNQLVAAALDRGKVAALIEVVATHYPELFQEEDEEE